jgi:hypothetical protein
VLHTLALNGSRKAARLGAEHLEAAIRAFGHDRKNAVARCRQRLATLPLG